MQTSLPQQTGIIEHFLVVADTDPLLAQMIEILLEKYPVRIISLTDGLETLSRVLEVHPSMLIMNMHLPHINGIRLCHVLRKNLQFRHLPIIMLYERHSIVDRLRLKMVRTTGYLEKPFDPQEFLQYVQKYIPQHIN